MYSRKYIRSPAVVSSIERIHPTVGGGLLSSPPKAEERSVTLPPDYTGMAFSGSGKSSALQNPGDYPETLIPPLEEAVSVADADVPDRQTEAVEPLSTETVEAISFDEADLPPAEPTISPEMAKESVADDGETAQESRQDHLQSTQSTQSTQPAAIPLLTPELLRSLTLEDLLLFWMLLMLTVSSQEDQIYLLLGLLLFNR